MIEIDNFREITKKDKVYLPRTNIGLSRTSLLIALIIRSKMKSKNIFYS
ncbi:hypothetical protein [Helicobacter japonicus]|nr:hypothetical protein [Helicobacter japonicus]